MGINSTTLKLSTMIDDLIGNRAGDTVRVTLSNLGLLLAGGGTLASAERMIAVEGLLADLVLDLGPIHASVAAGLSATIAGQQFRVQSADPDVSYSVYLHAASNTGTLIAAVPAPAVLSTIMADVAAAVTGKAAGVPDIESLAGVPIILDAAEAPVMTAGPQGLDFIPAPGLKARILDALDTPETLLGAVILEDGTGTPVMTATPTGINLRPSLELRAALAAEIPGAPSGAIWPVRLEDGRLQVCQITETGLLDVKQQAPFAVEVNPIHWVNEPFWVYPGPLDLMLITGQSLVGGARYTAAELAAGQIADLRVDALTYHWSTMTGYISWNTPWIGIAAVGEIDYIVKSIWNRAAEDLPQATPATVLGDVINRHRALTGAPRRTQIMMGINNPGTDIDRLDNDPATGPETTVQNWSNIQYFLPRAKAHAAAQGYEITTRWHLFDHGTADRFALEGEYYPKLVDYLADLDALYAANGLAAPRHLITQAGGYPYSGEPGYNHPWEVKLDQLRLAREGRAILACPHYPWEVGDDKVHPVARAVVHWAEIAARAIAEVEAGRPWTCLAPRLVEKTAGQIVLEFDTRPDEALAFNAQKYTAGCTAYGFEVVGALTTMTPPGFSSAGQVRAPIPISSVKITARNRVTIACDTTAAVQVKYAMQTQDMSANTDPYTSHRGLLRTDYGWPASYDGTQLYRWVPGFKLAL